MTSSSQIKPILSAQHTEDETVYILYITLFLIRYVHQIQFIQQALFISCLLSTTPLIDLPKWRGLFKSALLNVRPEVHSLMFKLHWTYLEMVVQICALMLQQIATTFPILYVQKWVFFCLQTLVYLRFNATSILSATNS